MNHRTQDLTGTLLDAAVAMAISRVPGYSWGMVDGRVALLDQAGPAIDPFEPSSDWSLGGPIIERERICVAWHHDGGGFWRAVRPAVAVGDAAIHCNGSTPLIAAMRAYVAVKLGDEVELP